MGVPPPYFNPCVQKSSGSTAGLHRECWLISRSAAFSALRQQSHITDFDDETRFHATSAGNGDYRGVLGFMIAPTLISRATTARRRTPLNSELGDVRSHPSNHLRRTGQGSPIRFQGAAKRWAASGRVNVASCGSGATSWKIAGRSYKLASTSMLFRKLED